MKSLVCYGAGDLRVEDTEIASLESGFVNIKIEIGGICGSDLHYFNHGGFGDIRIREPMVLGHEVAGRITALGEGVDRLKIGDLVAVNPSQPCRNCEYCDLAHYNHCLDMRYYGSAMRNPHVQGAFSEVLVVHSDHCHVFPEGTSASDGAFAEPLSVALHAIAQAGNLMGKKVLVTGTGPIGALVVAVAKHSGASEVVATDMFDEALARAEAVGADKVINVGKNPEALNEFKKGKGVFDVVIEASGSEPALLTALEMIRPHGRLIQLGLGDSVNLPLNKIVGKEIELCGSFRFHEEFAQAVDLIARDKLPLSSLLTGVYPIEDAVSAFKIAGDRSAAMKVQLSFT